MNQAPSPNRHGSIPEDFWKVFGARAWFWKLLISAFFWGTCRPKLSFWWGVTSWPLDLSLVLYFYHTPTVPWQQKHNFEARKYPLPTNEHVLESSRPPVSIPSSDAGLVGHLGLSWSHFQRSFDLCCRPWSCARSGSDKVVIIIMRPRQRAGLYHDVDAWG